MTLKITFLGTGTSHGVPVIGCSCAVCQSKDPKDKRNRCSVWVRDEETQLLIDAATEHRVQALRFGLSHVDAVLFTHPHADHISGLDDLRIYSERQKHRLPCYGNAPTLKGIQERFAYVFRRTQKGGGKPQLDLKLVKKEFHIKSLSVVPVPLWHGRLKTTGWRVGDLAYLTDTNRIPEESFSLLKGLKVMVLDALRPQPHPTHYCLPEAIAVAKKIGAQRTYFTHITHLLGHHDTDRSLPSGMHLAYDGLELVV